MEVGNQYLFPLTWLESFFAGYYMDAKGDVYSTRRGFPARMTGSSTSSGVYLTLNGRSQSKTALQRRAMSHPSFKEETSGPVKAVVSPGGLPVTVKRDHASSLAEGIAKRGWLVAKVALVQGEEALLFGSKPKVHTSQASVDDELARLATLNPGTKYVKLKIEGGLVLGGLTRL